LEVQAADSESDETKAFFAVCSGIADVTRTAAVAIVARHPHTFYFCKGTFRDPIQAIK
jgi:hypothetical protein